MAIVSKEMGANARLVLHKDGDSMGISTKAATVEEFWDDLASLLEYLIDNDHYQGDWEFQLRGWLPAAHIIARSFENNSSRIGAWRTTYCQDVQQMTRLDVAAYLPEK